MTPDSWVFRVASRPEYGGGHVRRCLALARALAPHAPVSFALDPGGEKWSGVIDAAGFAAATDGEAETTLPADGVVIDHCAPDAAMMDRWRRRTGRLVVFRDDDGSAGGIDDADIEVRQWAPPLCRPGLLAGPEYILIDPAFAKIEDATVRPLPAHVLVALGMRDSPDATSLVLAALAILAPSWQPQITVALGADAPHVPEVQQRVASLGPRGRLLLDAASLRDTMADCDLAVGAGGVAAAERVAAGRPSLTLALNESQRPVAAMLASMGATADCGLVQALSPGSLADALWALAGDPSRRARMAQAGRRAVDGCGPHRLAQALLATAAP